MCVHVCVRAHACGLCVRAPVNLFVSGLRGFNVIWCVCYVICEYQEM